MIITSWRNGSLFKQKRTKLLNGLLDFTLDHLALGASIEYAGRDYICLQIAADTIFFDGDSLEIYTLNKCAKKYNELWNKLGHDWHVQCCNDMECAQKEVRGAVFCQTEKLFAKCALMYALEWDKNTILQVKDKNFVCGDDFKKFVRRIEIGMDLESSLMLIGKTYQKKKVANAR